MSGGSMDYLYSKVADASFSLNTPLRRAFRAHLQLVADALHEIEWEDSGDGGNEAEAIEKCLSKGAGLQSAIEMAKESMKILSDEIKRAEGKR